MALLTTLVLKNNTKVKYKIVVFIIKSTRNVRHIISLNCFSDTAIVMVCFVSLLIWCNHFHVDWSMKCSSILQVLDFWPSYFFQFPSTEPEKLHHLYLLSCEAYCCYNSPLSCELWKSIGLLMDSDTVHNWSSNSTPQLFSHMSRPLVSIIQACCHSLCLTICFTLGSLHFSFQCHWQCFCCHQTLHTFVKYTNQSMLRRVL